MIYLTCFYSLVIFDMEPPAGPRRRDGIPTERSFTLPFVSMSVHLLIYFFTATVSPVFCSTNI